MSSNLKPDFLWGSASAAYQVEGAWNLDGKSESIWDRWVRLPGKTFQGTNGNIATDHYHRFHEDVELMAKMGLRAYRFSLSWTRILPNGTGTVNPKGIAFYNALIDDLIAHGITPLVTLYHWDLPACLQDEYGGWLSPRIVADFTYYCQVCFANFGDRIRHWIILNEPNIFTQQGYLLALHPPGLKDQKAALQSYHYTALAHAQVVCHFKEAGYQGMIGSSIAYSNGYAASESSEDTEALRRYYQTVCHYTMDPYFLGQYPAWGFAYYQHRGEAPLVTAADLALLKKGAQLTDFIGINYYQSQTIAHNPEDGIGLGAFNTTGKKGSSEPSGVPGLYKSVKNLKLDYTDWDWGIDPDGLTQSLLEIQQRYHKPLLITENGLGAYDKIEAGGIHDSARIDFIKKHVTAMEAAVAQGVDLLGYCTWSFTDILSWLNGYQKRYGFVYIDFDDPALPRIPKDSFTFYRDLIAANGDLTRMQ